MQISLLKIQKESKDAQAFYKWCKLHPIAKDFIFHIANGEHRDIRTASKLKSMGVRRGVVDYFLPYPVDSYCGLWIELKNLDPKSKISEEQKIWIERMRSVGYKAEECHGWEAAVDCVLNYLKGN